MLQCARPPTPCAAPPPLPPSATDVHGPRVGHPRVHGPHLHGPRLPGRLPGVFAVLCCAVQARAAAVALHELQTANMQRQYPPPSASPSPSTDRRHPRRGRTHGPQRSHAAARLARQGGPLGGLNRVAASHSMALHRTGAFRLPSCGMSCTPTTLLGPVTPNSRGQAVLPPTQQRSRSKVPANCVVDTHRFMPMAVAHPPVFFLPCHSLACCHACHAPLHHCRIYVQQG